MQKDKASPILKRAGRYLCTVGIFVVKSNGFSFPMRPFEQVYRRQLNSTQPTDHHHHHQNCSKTCTKKNKKGSNGGVVYSPLRTSRTEPPHAKDRGPGNLGNPRRWLGVILLLSFHFLSFLFFSFPLAAAKLAERGLLK